MAHYEDALTELRSVIRTIPVIDCHAHNLLTPPHRTAYPFESITTEAQSFALADTFKSLSHLRALRQLRELYECEDDADWDAVVAKRAQWLLESPDLLTRKCLTGVYSILMDDGLEATEQVYSYSWHDHFTQGPTKRIVRIEAVAEQLMEGIVKSSTDEDLKVEDFLADTWVVFTDQFERAITDAIASPEVAGFKSVVCYRTGLDVEPDYSECLLRVGVPFEHYVAKAVRRRKYRISRKDVNDYLVLKTLEILSERSPSDGMSKPLQFHTGLGDIDISLRRSNPAYLQPLIEQYPTTPFVLLHASYPYTREAGYLAAMFRNAYLDLGEVFPQISRDGQVSVIRQSLELVPGGKLLYSSDGHYFPETYWLALKQFREALEEILVEYISKNDLSVWQATKLAEDVMFNNSNRLYKLNFELNLQWGRVPQEQPLTLPVRQASGVYDKETFRRFMQENPSVSFVYVLWLDYMATMRTRILPLSSFKGLIESGGRIGISQGNTGTLQNDTMTPVCNPIGQIYVEPDLTTLRKSHRKDPLHSATVQAFWRDEAGRSIRECPRGGLQRLLSVLLREHGISLLVGFEIEVIFLKRNPADPADYAPFTTTHAWGTLTPEQWTRALPLLAEISTTLANMGITVEQFHAESGAGQYEFVLAPLPALEAIDALITARQVVHQIAETHQLRATLHPQPLLGAGTAAHAHVSLDPPDQDMEFWVGGVLEHLEAVCAFTMPEAVSYGRVKDDSWTGGTWVAWGTQNRETPLRRVRKGRWEVRSLDGTANMYLAVAAIVGAGLLGLRARGEGSERVKDCPYNPSKMTPQQRKEYGVVRRIPKDIDSALRALENDGELTEVLAEGLVHDFVTMKRHEQAMLAEMPEVERRVWLIERY